MGALTIDRLRVAAQASGNEARSAYLRFGVFGLYLAVVVGATAHEELLRGSTVTMPGLGVGLPIMGFYVLVPALFVLLHADLLLQLNLVAGHLRRLRSTINAIRDGPERELHRSLVPSTIFSEFLLSERRGSLLGGLQYLAIGSSLILLPLSVLWFVQVRFLPYHSAAVTGWHQALILADLLLIWLLWPRIVRTPLPAEGRQGEPKDLPKRWREVLRRSWVHVRGQARREGVSSVSIVGRKLAAWAGAEGVRLPQRVARHVGLLSVSLITVVLVLLVARLPEQTAPLRAMPMTGDPCQDDTHERSVETGTVAESPPLQANQACRPLAVWNYFDRVPLPNWSSVAPTRTGFCLTYLLFEAPTTPLDMRRNLRVRNASFVLAAPSAAEVAELGEPQAWAQSGRGLDLRGRDLRFADFAGSDLRKADLRGANLFGANLDAADLRHATAGDVSFKEFDGCDETLRVALEHEGSGRTEHFCRARLDSASLRNADLRHATFWKASMEKVNLGWADLRQANLSHAGLTGSNLQDSQLQQADLHGARLDDAELQRARLDAAKLSCAWLRRAKLQSANLSMTLLNKTRLNDADLTDAILRGAYLTEALLEQTKMSRAYFAGADLRNAVLTGLRLGSGPAERPFFGWADLRGTQGEPAYDEEALKDPQELWRRIAPQALLTDGSVGAPGPLEARDERIFEARLASLLVGRACDDATELAHLLGLGERALRDRLISGRVRTFHKHVASSLLRAGADGGDRPSAGSGNANDLDRCAQAAQLPSHLLANLRNLVVMPLGPTE